MLIDDRPPSRRPLQDTPQPAASIPNEDHTPIAADKPLRLVPAPPSAPAADRIARPDPATAHVGTATERWRGTRVNGRTAPPPLNWDAMPDAVLVADARGVLVAANQASRRVLGIDPDAVVGQRLVDVVPLIDDGGRSWWERTAPFHALTIVTRQPERLLVTIDGRPVLVTASFQRTDGPGSALTNLIVAIRPATERTRIERRGAELVATAAHELRSPLTSIKGFTAQLLAKWDRFSDDQRRLIVETVDHDADRLTRLIVELLDVARIDSHDVTLRCDWVDLRATIERSVATLVAGGALAERMRLEVPTNLPRIWADPDKIGRVFINLLENAFRHGDGLVTTTLERTVRDGVPGVSVSVTDEGEGIPEHLAARAFHKYWHASNDGTGLGLYVVRGLVEAHGGTISVDRGADGGARFRFLLPVGAPPA